MYQFKAKLLSKTFMKPWVHTINGEIAQLWFKKTTFRLLLQGDDVFNLGESAVSPFSVFVEPSGAELACWKGALYLQSAIGKYTSSKFK